MENQPRDIREEIMVELRKNGERFKAEQAQRKAQRNAKRRIKLPRPSMQIRVVAVIATLGIFAAALAAYVSYSLSMETAITTAESRGRVMFDVIAATRAQFRFVTRPKFEELHSDKEWVPELQSGFYMLRGVTDKFRERTDEMSFKQAARNPLHLPNKADEFDISVIEQFENDPNKKSVSGTLTKDGEPYYYYSEPFLVSKKRCLTCHGNPADAPAKQREMYGTTHGYGWEMDKVAAASIVYVPLEPAIRAANKHALRLVEVVSGSLGVCRT